MWAFRRSSVHLRNRWTAGICYVKSEVASTYLENCNAEFTQSQVTSIFRKTSFFSKSYSTARILSSLIGGKSNGDHKGVLEDASSRLETRHDTVQEAVSVDEMDDVDFADDVQNELELSDDDEAAADAGGKGYRRTGARSGLIKCIFSATSKLADWDIDLDRWVETGNEITRTEVSHALAFLKRHRLFVLALKLLEWLESRKHLEYTEIDYASRVDFIAKVKGMRKAEEYIEQQIPESFRSETVYVNLLRNYAAVTDAENTEKLFDKMKNLFPLTCKSYDQLLFLCKRTSRKKMVDVLSSMEKENIKPSQFTYKILLDAEGQSKNITEMELIYESLKRNGVPLNLRNQASVARYYAIAGLKDKAEAVLKGMEWDNAEKCHYVLCLVLPVYGLLGRDHEVQRIWNKFKSNPNMAKCIAAIKAWGQLKRIKETEEAFDEMLKILESPSSKHYGILLNIYADHGMVSKGEDLWRRMTESGVTAKGPEWDAAVKLYAGAGEIEKADDMLQKAIRQKRGRPHAVSFLRILSGYAGRGDVHNAEKIFLKMRLAGYVMEKGTYKRLIYAYVNANTPAYGFDMRLKRDGIVPDEKLTHLLARAAKFRESVTELLP